MQVLGRKFNTFISFQSFRRHAPSMVNFEIQDGGSNMADIWTSWRHFEFGPVVRRPINAISLIKRSFWKTSLSKKTQGQKSMDEFLLISH